MGSSSKLTSWIHDAILKMVKKMQKMRTIIQLDENQYNFIRRESFSRKVSISHIVRELIEREMMGNEQRKDIDKAMSFVGKRGCGSVDVARHHDDYLAGLKQ